MNKSSPQQVRLWWSWRRASSYPRSSSQAFFVKKNKKTMEITSQDQGKGEFYAAINLPGVTGEDVEAVFNYKYLLEGLANIEDEDVVYELNGSASPAVFKTKTGDYRHVVMPIKT